MPTAATSKPPTRSFMRIEGDLAEMVTETITKQVPIEVLQEQLVALMPSKKLDIVTPGLPVGTRFFVSRGEYEFYVIEQQPRKRVVLTGPDGHPGFFAEQKSNPFAMPYVIFVVQAVAGAKQVTPALRVFFSKEPLRSMDDKLLIAPLPNLDDRGTICVGSTPTGQGGNTLEAIEDVIANFWGSSFRYGGKAVYPGVFPNGVRPGLFDNWGSHGDGADFKKWSQDSDKHGDLFGLEIPWEASKYTVRKAIENPETGI